ncbi:helix-turn-helix transcriptional regulator [Eubacterium ramulus]
MLDAKEIGERLIKIRGSIPRDTVAKAVGISVSAISMYENGERIPRDAIKIKLAEFYGKSVQEIFFDSKCHI